MKFLVKSLLSRRQIVMALCAPLAALAFVLSGCSATSDEHASLDISSEASSSGNVGVSENPPEGAVQTDEAEAQSNKPGYLNLDEAINSEHYRLFVQRGDEFYPLSEHAFTGNTSTFTRDPSHLTQYEEAYDGGLFAIFPDNGDRIVTTKRWEKDVLLLYPITGEVYYGNSPANWGLIEEINGMPLDDSAGANHMAQIKECLAGLGVTIAEDGKLESSTPISFTIGEYEGTKFVEKSIDVATPSYVVYFGGRSYSDLPNPVELTLEKTKEGYFYADLSNVPAGKYALINENAMKNWVNKIDVIVIE